MAGEGWPLSLSFKTDRLIDVMVQDRRADRQVDRQIKKKDKQKEKHRQIN